jgi:hypothetical protein
MFKKIPISKIILILWLVFSVLYVGWNEWSRFKAYVMQGSYNQGVSDAVAKVIEESKSCKAFPVNIGESKATLVNVDCLKPQAEQPEPGK